MTNISVLSHPSPLSASWIALSEPRPSPRFEAVLSTYPRARASRPNGLILFGDYLEKIQGGAWRKVTERIRNATNPKAEKDNISSTALLAITPCGTFPEEHKKRNKKEILKYSGIIAIDIDEVNPETGEGNPPEILAKVPEILKQLPECLAFHRSIRGNGFAVFFVGGRLEEHEIFYNLYRSILEGSGVKVDSAPQAVNAYRFVSWDPDTWVNRAPYLRKMPMSSPASLPPREAKIQELPRKEGEEPRSIAADEQSSPPIEIDMIHPKNIGFKWGSGWDAEKPDGRYNEQEGEEAFRLLLDHGWRHLATRADGIRILQRPFKNPNESGGSATWGFKKNLFYVFTSSAPPFEANKSYPPFQILTLLKHGGDWKAAKDELRERYGMPKITKGRPKVRNVSEADEDAEDIGLKGSELLIHDYILRRFDLRFNTRTRRLEIDGKRLNDRDEKWICLITSSSLGLGRDGISTARDILGSHFIPKHDPFEAFFNKHRERPWKPVLHDLINTLAISSEDEEFSKLLIRKWLLGIIASMKGVHSTLCLVLIGDQGIGKTNFFRGLLPEELRNEYYAGHTLSDANEKDNDIMMSEKLVILDDEFAGRNKKEFEKLKANLSKETFTLRRAYGKHHEELPRLAVLCGTSNAKEILHDYTGNRRILPIEIRGMDEDAFALLNKNHLFMELEYEYLRAPKDFFLTAPEIARLNELGDGNEVRSLEHQAILARFYTPWEMKEFSPDHPARSFFTAFDIKRRLEIYDGGRSVYHIHMIGRACSQIGFKKIRQGTRKGGKDSRAWGYIMIEKMSLN